MALLAGREGPPRASGALPSPRDSTTDSRSLFAAFPDRTTELANRTRWLVVIV